MAVVTEGARGIGTPVAERLADEGALVVPIDVDKILLIATIGGNEGNPDVAGYSASKSG